MIPPAVLAVFEAILMLSLALCIGRLIKGPAPADRMVAIDLLGLLMAVLMISHAIRTGDETVLDVVMVFSIVAFFGTVALARHLQRETDEPAEK
jgi:multicomponent Na+:H+ antiporter subunit F